MSRKPEIVADNEPLGSEPEGFWEPIHAETARLSRLEADDADTSSSP